MPQPSSTTLSACHGMGCATSVEEPPPLTARRHSVSGAAARGPAPGAAPASGRTTSPNRRLSRHASVTILVNERNESIFVEPTANYGPSTASASHEVTPCRPLFATPAASGPPNHNPSSRQEPHAALAARDEPAFASIHHAVTSPHASAGPTMTPTSSLRRRASSLTRGGAGLPPLPPSASGSTVQAMPNMWPPTSPPAGFVPTSGSVANLVSPAHHLAQSHNTSSSTATTYVTQHYNGSATAGPSPASGGSSSGPMLHHRLSLHDTNSNGGNAVPDASQPPPTLQLATSQVPPVPFPSIAQQGDRAAYESAAAAQTSSASKARPRAKSMRPGPLALDPVNDVAMLSRTNSECWSLRDCESQDTSRASLKFSTTDLIECGGDDDETPVPFNSSTTGLPPTNAAMRRQNQLPTVVADDVDDHFLVDPVPMWLHGVAPVAHGESEATV